MILFTGFEAISDSKLTSDVNWGCMVRSSQMLVAQVTFICLDQSLFTTAAVNFDTLTVSSFEKKMQALIFHHLGRSWRKPLEKVSYILLEDYHFLDFYLYDVERGTPVQS
jgi:cysteine protease ATG4